MLHKSFKPAKCKTSLKLATARIKLMKNKKAVQMNQMKNDLAKLLQSGQDRTARIRVEHFIREEKMVAAYDLIELYCELIAARLPIIESQKNCPIDLKEAIASVIFAAPRCSDVPELLDVKKHFTAKYGKEFVTTALELRPNCGVGRMLVEKLSAVAPDGQAKFKVLNAIAEEHNIKWDSKSFEEKETKPVNDLVNGPSTFEKASEMAAEAPEISVSNVQATSSHDRHSKPLNFTEPNTVSSIDAHNVLPVNRGGRNTTATTHSDLRRSGNETKVGSHSFAGDEDYSSRQDWKMEFKNARSAAQAAAESAERASMAARAAAEFSRRENDSRPLSSESKNSINNSTRQERPGTYASSELPGEHFGNVPVKNSYHSGNSKVRNEQIVRGEYQSRVEPDDRFRTYDDANTRKTSHPTSLRSGESTLDDIKSVNNMQKAHEYSEKTSFEETTKQVKEPLYSRMGMKQHYVESRDESSSSWQDDSTAEHFDQYGEARMEKQDQLHSSRSHSSTESETDDITFKESENNAAKDLYVGNDQDDMYRDTTRMNSYDDKLAFEEYDSSDGSHNLDKPPQYDEGESTSYVPPLGSNSSFSSISVDIWNPRKDTIKSPEKSTFEAHHFTEDHPSTLFSESTEKMLDLLGPDNVPVAPYDFDGPKFDSEDEVEMPIHEQNKDVFSLDPESAHTENYGSTEPLLVNRKSSGYDRKPSVGSSSDDDIGTVEAHQQSNPTIVVNSESPKFDSEYKQNIRQSSNLSLVHMDEDSFHVTGSPEILKDEDLQLQSNSEEESKLNFGTLTGGFRNKGHRHLPSIRNLSGDSSSVTLRNTDESSAMSEQKTAAPSLESSVNTTARTDANKKSSFSLSTLHSDSDSQTDDSGDEVQQNITSGRQASLTKKPSKEVKYKSSFRPPVVTYFDLDNDDYNDDVSKPNVPNKIQLGSAISRRTKPSPSGTGPKSYSQIQAEHQESASPTSSKERTPTRSHPDNATPTKLKSEMESTGYLNSEEQPNYAKKVASKASVSGISSGEKPSNFPNSSKERTHTRSRPDNVPPTKLKSEMENTGYLNSDEQPNYAKNVASKASVSKISSDEKPSNSSAVEQSSSAPRRTGASSSPQNPKSEMENTGYLNSDEQPNYAKKVASKASVSEISSDEKPSNSSAVEQPSSAPRRIGASSSPQNPKTSKLTGDPPAREDSKKRASHVHPKLPDYDNIAYHLQYLRTDKQ